MDKKIIILVIAAVVIFVELHTEDWKIKLTSREIKYAIGGIIINLSKSLVTKKIMPTDTIATITAPSVLKINLLVSLLLLEGFCLIASTILKRYTTFKICIYRKLDG